MKKAHLELLFSVNRQKAIRTLIVFGVLYMVLVSFEIPFVFRNGFRAVNSSDNLLISSTSASYGFLNYNSKPFLLESEENLEEKEAPIRPLDMSIESRRKVKEVSKNPLSSLNFTAGIDNLSLDSGIFKSAKDAIEIGRKQWRDLELIAKNGVDNSSDGANSNRSGSSSSKVVECPHSLAMSGEEFTRNKKLMVLPCGLTLGSHVTVVAKPRAAHKETDPKISLLKEGQYVMVSQFMMELQGLKAVDGEDPPRILHFNPRLKGDWSGKPMIEQNTCYRMQWGTSQRCEGWKSRADEETGM